jgi:hypothetical protein
VITSLDLELAGVPVRFRCDLEPLGAYARAHLEPILSSETSGAAPAVDAELRWHEGHPPPPSAYPETLGAERLDRDVYARPGDIVWLRVDDLRDLHLRFRWDGERLGVRGDFYHRLATSPGADRLRRLVYRRQLAALRRKRFTRLLYYLVYYPVFWWLEHVRGTHPIHAGAVDAPAGGIVLAGPSGVGKSTLTVALGAAEGCRLLSDTFVAQRGAEVWAVPEPLLLDRWSIDWLGEAGAALTGLRHSYALGRDGYVLPRGRYAERTRAAAVVLPRRASEHYVRRIDGETALSRIMAYDDIVNDLRRYRPLAAVLELLDPVGLGRARLQSLHDLTSGTPCFEVGMNDSLTRAEAVSALLALCHDRERQHSLSGGGRGD